jgi:hypothetical protein
LRKNAIQILKKMAKKLLGFKRRNRIGNNNNLSPTLTGSGENGKQQIRIKAIDTAIGGKMSIPNWTNEMDKHFLMLKNQWN